MRSFAVHRPRRGVEDICVSKTGSTYREYLNSERWQAVRLEVMAFHGFKCQKCLIPRWLAKIAFDQDLNVHHESYANLGTEAEYGDLSTLCRRCHDVATFGRSDLRAPKSAICDICQAKHWNPWAGKCETCTRIIAAGGDGLMRYVDQPDECVGFGASIEEVFIHWIIAEKGIPHILNRITEYEKYTRQSLSAGADEDIPF